MNNLSTAASVRTAAGEKLRTSNNSPLMKVIFIQRILRFAIAKTKDKTTVPLSPSEQMHKIVPFCGLCKVWTETIAHYSVLSDIFAERRSNIIHHLLSKHRTLLPITLDGAVQFSFGWADFPKNKITLDLMYTAYVHNTPLKGSHLEDQITPKTLEEIVAAQATWFSVVKICIGDNVSESQFAAFVAAMPDLEELCILHTSASNRPKFQENLLKTPNTPNLKTIRQVHLYDAAEMIKAVETAGMYNISSALDYDAGSDESRDVGMVLQGRAQDIPRRLRCLYATAKEKVCPLLS